MPSDAAVPTIASPTSWNQLAPQSPRAGIPRPDGKPGRFNKACDSCHVSKVRCVPDTKSPIGTCKRCSKNGNPCVFSPVGPRRRPTRTKNDRIAELEKRVRDMQLRLERQVEKRATGSEHDSGALGRASSPIRDSAAAAQTSTHQPPSATGVASGEDVRAGPGSESSSGASEAAGPTGPEPATKELSTTGASQAVPVSQKTREQESAASSSAPGTAVEPRKSSAARPDVIEQGLLTSSQAERLVQEFRLHLDGKFLAMRLPDGFASSRMRREKPALWLSILCAASTGSTDFVSLAPKLFGEMKQVLDQRITSGAPPDIDALQALINYTIFHFDPVHPLGRHMLGVWSTAIHMVVQMAESSGLRALPPPAQDGSLEGTSLADDDVQLARELLRWHWASLSLTVKNRQSTMLRQTELIEASIRALQTTQNRHDMCLVEWTRLARIAAETVLALHHGHTQEAGGLSDVARDEILEEFERRRKRWLVECPFDFVNELLMLDYHYYVLLVSEVIYPAGPADFQRRSHGLPSLALSPKTSTPLPDQHFFAPYKLRYTRKCIIAAHACLDLATRPRSSADDGSYHYDKCPTEDLLRRFGVIPYSRIFYALRFLLFVAHEIWRTKRSDVVDFEDLRLEVYLAALKRCLGAASSGGKYRVPSLWLYALETRIEPWYQRLHVLLQRDQNRAAARREPEEEQTPRASSGQAAPALSLERGSLDARTRAQQHAQKVAEAPLSPRQVGFQPDVFSGLDMLSPPLSSALPQPEYPQSSHPPISLSTVQNGHDSLNSTASTQITIEELQSAYRTAHPDSTLDLFEHDFLGSSISQAGNVDGLDEWVGTLSMNSDPFKTSWDYFDEVFPENFAFQPSMPLFDLAENEPSLHSELKTHGASGGDIAAFRDDEGS